MSVTLEHPAPGLVVAQPRRGFRYSAEAFWLAGFALEGGPAEDAVELGTGSGIVALLLASHGLQVVGYDVRPEWEICWAETLARSRFPGSLRLEVRDVAAPIPDRVDLVVSNPPFFPAGNGPASADPWKAAARTESTASLRRFVEAGLEALRPRGRLCLVVPAERIAEVERAARTGRIGLRRVVTVGRRRVLVELGEPTRDVKREALREDDPRVLGWYTAVARAVAPS